MKFNNTIIINFIINGMQIYIIENYKIINKHRINFIGLVTTILQILFRKFCNHGGLQHYHLSIFKSYFNYRQDLGDF